MPCQNKTYLDGRWIQDGWITNQAGKPIAINWIYLMDTNSKECRSDYDLEKKHFCKDCTVKRDDDYLKDMGLL